jgi:hypothetical protein
MFVFSNRRRGAAAEVVVSEELAVAMLAGVAAAAGEAAGSHWERELTRWLTARAGTAAQGGSLDVSDLAWSPENFLAQQQFVLSAIADAARAGGRESKALARWGALVEAHPRSFVQVGRRWNWHATA